MRGYKLLLLASSLATLALLVSAALRENVYAEWRTTQRELRDRLPEDRRGKFEIELRQIVVPELGVVDRCVTCHVGMAPGERGVPGGGLLAAHTDVVHDPADVGCTICHGGQGRATARDAAHGNVPHWPEPMIPRKYAYAGCGTCHTHLAVPSLARLEEGRAIFERSGCRSCHRVGDRGGERAGGDPALDLSRAGAKGWDPEWHVERDVRPAAGVRGAMAAPVPALDSAEREAIEAWLASLVGAPGLIESKAVFHSRGCRGCHVVAGVGGVDGPELTRAGQRDPGQTNFAGVAGPRTLEAWQRAHLRAPSRVVPGSRMPELGFSEAELDALTFYLFSLRRSPVPERWWPNDRMRAERFGAREFAPDGATLYGTFCAACHGASGQGMRYAGSEGAFPAIASRDFLALASDELLAETIRRGRPGRRMPAFGQGAGGLMPDEIGRIVEYVRQLGGGIPPPEASRPKRWVSGDAQAGERIFAANCAGCHGRRGEGGEGPMLANPVLLEHASDDFLVGTIARGRGGTAMPPWAEPAPARRTLGPREIEDVVAFIRTWERKP